MTVSILDCTLRDGGYINDFRFGVGRINTIKEKLCEANIEIIECGFLQSAKNDPDCSLYGGVEQILLPKERGGRMFVAMSAFGDITAEEIVPYQANYIDGIRLTFHNKEWEDTKRLTLNLMNKGYKVFIQPVSTLFYTDEELLTLIKEVNFLKPYAFYLVDTIGSMYKNDLLRLFFLVEHNLADGICLGYHSHNNMQLSFANAMTIMELHTNRHIIIDSSVFGMGRGAGNLNTELITHYINNNIEHRYDLIPLLEMIDDIILPIYKYTSWGFSEPYYLSAIIGVHPNYAAYLIDKQSIGMTQIAEILGKIPKSNGHLFIKSDIEKLYHAEMSDAVDDSSTIAELSVKIRGKEVIVIAPGSSIRVNRKQILEHIRAICPFVLSLNFIPDDITPDLVFISNRKRFTQLKSSDLPLVVTSNIKTFNKKNIYVVDYDSLISQNVDYGGIMVLRFVLRLGATYVSLAGYDGFTGGIDHYDNTQDSYLSVDTVAAINNSMSKQLSEISKVISLKFITPSVYKVINDDQ
jgi:4-hydroxy 2-oxovalerate aldolase